MTKYLVYGVVLVGVMIVGCGSLRAETIDVSQSADNGPPFGNITTVDTNRLMQFAKEKGLDMRGDLKKAYAKDTNALAAIFRFSLEFKSLDQNARTYGQMLYSNFLTLAQAMGPEQYSAVVVAQTPEVQQRIRDFLYFPVTRVPAKERAVVDNEVRGHFPRLFPPAYHFGEDDPLFTK